MIVDEELAEINAEPLADDVRRTSHFKAMKAQRGPTLRERVHADLCDSIDRRVSRREMRKLTF